MLNTESPLWWVRRLKLIQVRLSIYRQLCCFQVDKHQQYLVFLCRRLLNGKIKILSKLGSSGFPIGSHWGDVKGSSSQLPTVKGAWYYTTYHIRYRLWACVPWTCVPVIDIEVKRLSTSANVRVPNKYRCSGHTRQLVGLWWPLNLPFAGTHVRATTSPMAL